MRVLGVIPARGGSKGVPRKNIKPLGGKPLLQYTVEAARAATRLERVILSTDDEEIAEVGRRLGVDVPFVRPTDLAADVTPMLGVVQHALDAVGSGYDAVCLLQPTSPFRAPGLIDECITLLEEREADAVITVLPVPAEHNPHWVYCARPDGSLSLFDGRQDPIPRRQDLPAAFCREGSVYVTRASAIRAGSLYGRKVMGRPIDPASTVNIDTADDFDRAEALVGNL